MKEIIKRRVSLAPERGTFIVGSSRSKEDSPEGTAHLERLRKKSMTGEERASGGVVSGGKTGKKDVGYIGYVERRQGKMRGKKTSWGGEGTSALGQGEFWKEFPH